MDLTIIEIDPLRADQYENFTPDFIIEQRIKNQRAMLVLGLVVIGLLILLLVIERYSDRNL